jgi:microcystin-dependent protein
MSKSKHSKNIKYIMGALYLYDSGTRDWVKIDPSSVGDLKYSARSSDHGGWLKCDGRSLLRTEYPDLFEVIGTSFGSNDASTFKLPDTRGRVLGAIGTGVGLTARILGDTIGSETHTLTVNEMPSHSHTGTTDSSGTHTHTNNSLDGTLGLMTSNGSNTASGSLDTTTGEPNLYASPEGVVIDSAGAHTHTFTTVTSGNSQAHNNMQPTSFIGNVFIFGYRVLAR